MAYKDYEKAMSLAPGCEYYTCGKGLSDGEIRKAESMLGLDFSPQLVDYYRNYNYLSFGGYEVFGIDFDRLTEVISGNSLAYALYDRENYDLPKSWLPIHELDDGYLACLDYGRLNSEKEPPVISCICTEEGYTCVESLADDFGSYVLGLVEMALEDYIFSFLCFG